MATSRLLVTGASGHLGRQVVELLVAKGESDVIATTRSPEGLSELSKSGKIEVRGADFDDEGALVRAFKGASRALLVSAASLDSPGRSAAQHARAVKALEEAGVSHVVYTSIPSPYGSPITIASDHAATEFALAASTLDFTILRNNLYTDALLPCLRSAAASGLMLDTRDDGAVAYVTREDCAHVAAAALSNFGVVGRTTLDVTGPEALTGDQLAGILSDVSGRTVTRYCVPLETLVFSLVDEGVPEAIAKTIASFDIGARRGDLASTSDAVAALSGRAPQSVRAFLADHRDALTQLGTP